MRGYAITELARLLAGELVAMPSGKGMTGGPAAAADSRLLAPGEIFFALAGEHTDGHLFLEEAFRKGASIAVVRKDRLHSLAPTLPSDRMFAVEDPVGALVALARHHRQRFHPWVLAITGSNGKTTTKELLASIFSSHGPTLASRGNYNTLLGLSLTLLRMEQSHRYVILELGISAPGEMNALARLAVPNAALITNVHAAHLEGLGSVENVAREKCVLLSHLEEGGAVYVNGDDPVLLAEVRRHGGSHLTYGLGKACDVRPVRSDPWGEEGICVSLAPDRIFSVALYGHHQVANLLAALAIARDAGLSDETIARGLSRFEPPRGRFHPRREGGVLLIDDTYNANPASLHGALDFLVHWKGEGRRYLLLGDMLELGKEEAAYHLKAGQEVAAAQPERVWLVGRLIEKTAQGALASGFPGEKLTLFRGDRRQLAREIAGVLEAGDCLLAKGSRGMRLEEILGGVREALSRAGVGREG